MSIACELPVDAGRAGRRLFAMSRAVPALGLLSCALLLLQGPPAWAETWLTDMSLRGVQAIFATAGLAGIAWAFQALSGGSRHAGWARGRRSGSQSLKLEQSGLARLGNESLRLDSVCSLPGLIVAVFVPISPLGPKLSGSSLKPLAWLARRRHRVLLIGRDALNQDQWRKLHVWLLWVQRAPH